jgi:hypothetical protein
MWLDVLVYGALVVQVLTLVFADRIIDATTLCIFVCFVILRTRRL